MKISQTFNIVLVALVTVFWFNALVVVNAKTCKFCNVLAGVNGPPSTISAKGTKLTLGSSGVAATCDKVQGLKKKTWCFILRETSGTSYFGILNAGGYYFDNDNEDYSCWLRNDGDLRCDNTGGEVKQTNLVFSIGDKVCVTLKGGRMRATVNNKKGGAGIKMSRPDLFYHGAFYDTGSGSPKAECSKF